MSHDDKDQGFGPIASDDATPSSDTPSTPSQAEADAPLNPTDSAPIDPSVADSSSDPTPTEASSTEKPMSPLADNASPLEDDFGFPGGDGFGNNDDKPAIAESNTKNMMLIAGIIGICALLLLWIFSGDDTPPPAPTTPQANQPSATPRPTIDRTQSAATPAPLPVLPNRPQPLQIAPPVVPILPQNAAIAPPRPEDNKKQGNFSSEELNKRIRSAIMVKQGSGIVDAIAGGSESNEVEFEIADTPATNVRLTKTGNPSNIIVQGKMIDAVLETAINTDLPGKIRAIVSRDVYAEAGKKILIPKGSRLYGSYNTDVSRGQARVYMIWERVIRPDGTDVMIESGASDILGKSGVPGDVDNKYFEIFTNQVLISALTVGFSAAAQAMTDGGTVEQGETGSGDTTTTGDVTDIAVLDAVDDFGNTLGNVAAGLINLQPTITIDQGIRIKVFVNRDVIFPGEARSGVLVVQ